MARVKSGKVTRASHKKVLKAAKGASRPVRATSAPPGGRQGEPVRDPRPQAAQAQLPRAVDPAHRCCVRAVDLEMTYSRFINGLALAGIEVDARFWRISPSTSESVCGRRQASCRGCVIIPFGIASRTPRRQSPSAGFCISQATGRGKDSTASTSQEIRHGRAPTNSSRNIWRIGGAGDEPALEEIRLAALDQKGEISLMMRELGA